MVPWRLTNVSLGHGPPRTATPSCHPRRAVRARRSSQNRQRSKACFANVHCASKTLVRHLPAARPPSGVGRVSGFGAHFRRWDALRGDRQKIVRKKNMRTKRLSCGPVRPADAPGFDTPPYPYPKTGRDDLTSIASVTLRDRLLRAVTLRHARGVPLFDERGSQRKPFSRRRTPAVCTAWSPVAHA